MRQRALAPQPPGDGSCAKAGPGPVKPRTDTARAVVTVTGPALSAADVVLTNELGAVPHLPGTGAGLGLLDAGGLALLALLALAGGVARDAARAERPRCTVVLADRSRVTRRAGTLTP